MSDDKFKAKKGLEGVIFDSSAISKASPEKKHLIYRGYPVHELATRCSFEEVAYLLLNDDLPNTSQLDEFIQTEKSLRKIENNVLETIKLFPKPAHPMDKIRTGVSFLGMLDPRPVTEDLADIKDKAMNLFAKIPTIVAAANRCKNGLEPIEPRSDLSFSENFFNMCFGEVPDPVVVKAFDASLILYAEHGFNASTFTSRVIVSSLSGIYGAVTGAIASLKGPLHGGANEAVMHMLKEMESPEKAKEWVLDALKNKKKIMGFGHRLYRWGDSRVPTMSMYRDELAKVTGESKWVDISKVAEETMLNEKGIHPNLDFPAGPAYYMMGFEIPLFTPIFVMARVVGWSAHVIEQLSNNRLVRPLSEYTGPAERPISDIKDR